MFFGVHTAVTDGLTRQHELENGNETSLGISRNRSKHVPNYEHANSRHVSYMRIAMISIYPTRRTMPASNSHAGPVQPSFLAGSKFSKPGSGLVRCIGGKARVKSRKASNQKNTATFEKNSKEFHHTQTQVRRRLKPQLGNSRGAQHMSG